jgi:hypothetical protein
LWDWASVRLQLRHVRAIVHGTGVGRIGYCKLWDSKGIPTDPICSVADTEVAGAEQQGRKWQYFDVDQHKYCLIASPVQVVIVLRLKSLVLFRVYH